MYNTNKSIVSQVSKLQNNTEKEIQTCFDSVFEESDIELSNTRLLK
jgi:hypothetical protein